MSIKFRCLNVYTNYKAICVYGEVFPGKSAHRQTAYDYNLSKTTLRMINKHVNRAT